MMENKRQPAWLPILEGGRRLIRGRAPRAGIPAGVCRNGVACIVHSPSIPSSSGRMRKLSHTLLHR